MNSPLMQLRGKSPLETALSLRSAGLSPTVIAPGGKAPNYPEWGRRRTDREIRSMFATSPTSGVGVNLGPDAGPEGRWLIDCEGDGPEAEESLLRLLAGEVVPTLGWTSRRGQHRLYFVDPERVRRLLDEDLVAPILKHPMLPDLELRLGGAGKAFQSVVPPTPGEAGVPREWNGESTIADLPEAAYVMLEQLGRALRPDGTPSVDPSAPAEGDGRPGTDFSNRGLWDEVLLPAGFTPIRKAGQVVYWTRPGKSEGISASTGFGDADLLYAWSTNAGLPAGKWLTKFRAYALLHHEGNFSAAAATLAAQGYGGQSTAAGAPSPATGPIQFESRIGVRPWPEQPDLGLVAPGSLGKLIEVLGPSTEASAVGLAVSFILGVGNLVGREVCLEVGASTHHANLFAALVGPTATGRKGTIESATKRLMSQLERSVCLGGVTPWCSHCNLGGLSSGEGLIFSVRDPVKKPSPVKQKGQIIDYQEEIVDAGVSDKRLMITEPELGRTFQVMAREGNTLSAVVRQAFDSGGLNCLTKSSVRATGAHISIVGHITGHELMTHLTESEAANGFANRFLWICVKRARLLPNPAPYPEAALAPHIEAIAVNLRRFSPDGVSGSRLAVPAGPRILRRLPETDRLWGDFYVEQAADRFGLLGSVLARGAPITLRLAMIYAIMDGADAIGEPHLRSAIELWRYNERCAAYLFGDSLGNDDADQILAALKSQPDGLSQTDIHNLVFNRHRSATKIERALHLLLEANLIQSHEVRTGGRPRRVWRALAAIAA